MTGSLFDEARFLQSLADDDELARELLGAFMEDSLQRVEGLRQALGANDAATVAKLAHSLKGMCGVVRVDRLQEIALNMECMAREGMLDRVRKDFAEFTRLLAEASEDMKEYMARG